MLAADEAAVANAPCVGLIMETDSNKTAQQRTVQTGSRLCVISFWFESCVLCSWELCAIDACISPGDTHCVLHVALQMLEDYVELSVNR